MIPVLSCELIHCICSLQSQTYRMTWNKSLCLLNGHTGDLVHRKIMKMSDKELMYFALRRKGLYLYTYDTVYLAFGKR